MTSTITKQFHKRYIGRPSGKHQYVRYLTEERIAYNRLRSEVRYQKQQDDLERLRVEKPEEYRMYITLREYTKSMNLLLYGDGGSIKPNDPHMLESSDK